MRFFTILFFVFASAFTAEAARTDTVYLYNGDRVTGEIKYLRDNKLSFKTDRAGIISIEWPSVARIYSANYFDLVTINNKRFFGQLLFSEEEGFVNIKLGSSTEKHNLHEIVGMEQIKSGFFEQLTGTISISASYTKANKNLQINGGFDITHRSKNYENALKANTVISSSENTDQTQRSEASYSLTRLYSSPWFSAASLSFQSNTELNINSRYQVFGGGGYFFIRKPGNNFYTTTGLSANREQSIAEPVIVTENIEYVAALRFHQFKFRNPQFDVLTSVITYTSLNNLGRFRFDFELTLLWELFNDFKLNITLYDNFDNRPPGGGNSLNSWNILTGLTYSI